MTHRPTLDCPCRPETRNALGGGRVLVHRDGRESGLNRAPDRLCQRCSEWHLVGHPHLT